MSSSTTHRARRPWPKWVAIIGWTLLGALGVTFLVFVLTVTFGAVHGTEFCPQTFERRSYSFYELPLVGRQLTGVKREDLTTAAETFLTSQKYITPPAGGPQDWHIIVGSRGTRQQRQGDAGILISYLDAKNSESDYRWVKWSEDHPEIAKLLWPAVQRLAEQDLYVFIPDLFDLAKSIDDPEQLRQRLDREISRCFLFLARRLQKRGDHPAALKLIESAIQLDPTNADVEPVRETSLEAEKNREKPPP